MEPNYQEQVALFRYRAILPLLSGSLSAQDEKRIKEEILEKEHEFSDGTKRKIKGRTLRGWLWRYRKHGMDGLYYANRQPKKTQGTCRAIPEALLNVARELREESLGRSVEQILQIMQAGKGLDVSEVCPRTLMRYFKRLGLKKGRKNKGQGQHERYEQELINAMWQGDTAHTFFLSDPNNLGQVKKAKLVVLIDDASRICPHGEFYFDEQLPSVLDAIAKALLARGKPTRILLDNAKTFRSTTLELMCAELDVGLSFCRSRRPQGKGKIERFIRNIKESFCNEASKAANITTLEELNAAFQGWLKRYENRIHDELNGMTPAQRWRREEHRIDRSLTETQILRAMMLRETRTVHISTALVNVRNREYQASRELAGQEFQIRWNPERLDSVELWKDGRYLETAMLKERKPHVERDWRQDASDEAASQKLASAGEYCAALMADHIPAVRARGTKDLFKLNEFIELLSAQLGRQQPFEEEEQTTIGTAFKRLAPLERAETEEKIERAIEDKGAEQHVRFYLERLEPKAFRR
jgi:putative transposase